MKGLQTQTLAHHLGKFPILCSDGKKLDQLQHLSARDLTQLDLLCIELAENKLLCQRSDTFLLQVTNAVNIKFAGLRSERTVNLSPSPPPAVSTHTEGEDKIQVLLMVEGRRYVGL